MGQSRIVELLVDVLKVSSLYTCSTPGKGPLQVRFDNIKVWQLENLPGPP
jgi:hypothetical protein